LQSDDRKQPARYVIRGAIERNEPCRTVIRNYRKNGTMFWNELTLIPSQNTEQTVTHYLGMQHDVSVNYYYNELQAAYEAINDQLNHTKEQNIQLRQMYERLEANNERYNKWVRMLVHDIQNPISAILSFVEILRNPAELGLTTEEVKMYGDVAYETAERILPMIRQLMQNDRTNATISLPVKLFALNVSTIAELLIRSYQPRAIGKNIQLEFDIVGASWVMGDEELLYEIIDNLLSNALKYTPPGKRIGLIIRQTQSTIQVEVWDEGPGLTLDDKKRIFKEEGSLSARPTAGESSVGIGLVAVAHWVASVQGRVWCESEQGAGARFIVELPRMQESA
jgi:two-component system, sensor histidine kinase and response regulator